MPLLPDTQARLTLRGLCKTFGRHRVLDGVHLDIAPGSVVLLAGINGSGKTTLLRCAAGLASYEGVVAIDGKPCNGEATDRRRLGYLPQAVGLPEWATVAEVLALFGRLRDVSTDTMDIPEGFLPPPDKMIGQLSGGQRQRVAIGVALLGRPHVLLLDEPASNLDETGRAHLFDILSTARDLGASVLVAAPSPLDLNGLPDRTVTLVDGRIVEPPLLVREVAS